MIRHEFYDAWEPLLGPVTPEQRGRTAGDPSVVEIGEPVLSRHGLAVQQIRLNVGDGDEVPGLLQEPPSSPRGIAIVCHQTTEDAEVGVREPFGIAGDEELAYGEELAVEGYAVVGVDYPSFGSYEVDPYSLGYESVSAKGLWNHLSLIECARQRWPGLGLAVFGHSLGGTNALFAAAASVHDVVVVCSAALCTFASFEDCHGSLERWAKTDKYMPRVVSRYGSVAANMPVEYGEVPLLIAPTPMFCNCPQQDDIFPIQGAREAVEKCRPGFTAGDFAAVFPDVGHAFPRDARQQSYAFVNDKLSGERVTPHSSEPA